MVAVKINLKFREKLMVQQNTVILNYFKMYTDSKGHIIILVT